jgi:hypothetical protein
MRRKGYTFEKGTAEDPASEERTAEKVKQIGLIARTGCAEQQSAVPLFHLLAHHAHL